MNKIRRKNLAEAQELLRQAADIIETAQSEEQECYDNLPESLQYSERGDQMQEYIDTMESVLETVNESIDSLDEITG